MDVKKYTTNKGKAGIIVDGHKYRLDKAFKNSNVSRCTKTGCKAWCKTDLTDLIIVDGRIEHDHETEDEKQAQRSRLRQIISILF